MNNSKSNVTAPAINVLPENVPVIDVKIENYNTIRIITVIRSKNNECAESIIESYSYVKADPAQRALFSLNFGQLMSGMLSAASFNRLYRIGSRQGIRNARVGFINDDNAYGEKLVLDGNDSSLTIYFHKESEKIRAMLAFDPEQGDKDFARDWETLCDIPDLERESVSKMRGQRLFAMKETSLEIMRRLISKYGANQGCRFRITDVSTIEPLVIETEPHLLDTIMNNLDKSPHSFDWKITD